MGRQAALIAFALAAAGCAAPPFGEVLVNVDSEPSVPAFVGRLRVDLFTPEMVWYESRDIVTPDASTWPISFGLYTDQPGEKLVRVRLRGYPEGAVRDYEGERFDVPAFVEPPSAHSLAELCADPPELLRATSQVFRRAAQPVTELVAQADCQPPTKTGSVAVKVTIAAAGTYHFAVVDSLPEGARSYLGGDTTLLLRTACADPASQVACNDDVDAAAGITTSAFDAPLAPGTYFLVSGGKYASPADLTLRWDDAADFQPVLPPPPSYGPPAVALDLDGGPTPTDEPQPNLAIDRLVDVAVDYGELRTADLLLRGECFGTQADLFGGRTCTDTAGMRVPVDRATLRDGTERAAGSVQGSWSAERPTDCTVAPRPRSAPFDGTEVYDEEVCVPGGVFTLGDPRLVGLTLDAIPGQMAVTPPLLVDRYEYTVARYRQALASGFVSPDDSPWENDAPLDPTVQGIASLGACTFSTAPMGRETLPLSCLSWYTARALCQREGGDLPSRVEWEWAATAAGRAPGVKPLYPWGDDPPTCDLAVWGRGSISYDCAPPDDKGPQPVALDPWASADRSAAGVSGMAGNQAEWLLDSEREYRDPCWFQHPLRGVGCTETEAPVRSTGGGAWAVAEFDLRVSSVSGFSAGVGNLVTGFRCARKGAP